MHRVAYKLPPKIISSPNKIRTNTIGVSHHFLLCMSMDANSLRKPDCLKELVMSEKSTGSFSLFMYVNLKLLDITTIGFGLFDIFPIAKCRMSSFFQFGFSKKSNQKGIGAKYHIVEKRHGGPNDCLIN